ncbi:DUF3868 domain-containing protein [Parabacteroides sp. PF5-6]|uniref:DUF3868 domain-containing protein n=1 Tax=Parabacteroides sp. PF5-6 TaxID=1742403 RepID=UPI002405CD31|nr:DUF3868 domain-containing protein [Parabacteroides sp. PF5-6]MDF9831433.1 hypothetical protein [Parabacteroides sp. PF5-6]
MKISLLYIVAGLLLFPVIPKAQDPQPKVYTGSVHVKQNVAEVRNDSVFLDMDITLYGVPVHSDNTLLLTPVLLTEKDSLRLPYIRIHGTQKDRMYKRSVTLSKGKKEDRSAYVILRHDSLITQVVSYRDTLAYEPWMKEASLLLEGSFLKYNGKPSAIYRDMLTEDLYLSPLD